MIEAHPRPLRPVLPLSDRMPTPLLTPLLTLHRNPLSIPFLPTFITDVGVISVDKKLRRSRIGVERLRVSTVMEFVNRKKSVRQLWVNLVLHNTILPHYYYFCRGARLSGHSIVHRFGRPAQCMDET